MSVLKKIKVALWSLLLSLFVFVAPASAQPGNCEECFDLPQFDQDSCFEDKGCNEVSVSGNVWVLALGGLVLAYFAYGRKNKSTKICIKCL